MIAIQTTLFYKSQCSLTLAYMQYLANNRYQYAYVTKFTSESLLAKYESYKIDLQMVLMNHSNHR